MILTNGCNNLYKCYAVLRSDFTLIISASLIALKKNRKIVRKVYNLAPCNFFIEHELVLYCTYVALWSAICIYTDTFYLFRQRRQRREAVQYCDSGLDRGGFSLKFSPQKGKYMNWMCHTVLLYVFRLIFQLYTLWVLNHCRYKLDVRTFMHFV